MDETKRNIKQMSYGRHLIDDDDINEVVKVLRGDWLTTGPYVKEFEKQFAISVGSEYAVAVSNGTAALHLACIAAGLKKDDEVITSPITFVASANCALYCGAHPTFVDINESGLMDETKIEDQINSNTKIIIPVHYSGLPCKMKAIKEIADRHNLIVIEDAAHALGSKYNGSKIGECKYSDMSTFSFHPVKQITTGEGGMITTNSKELFDRLILLRNHGITKNPESLVLKNEGQWYQEMQDLGFNYRLTDFQCALGISQLKKLDKFVKKRREIANVYDKAFYGNENVSVIKEENWQFSSYHLYVIKVNNKEIRLRLFNHLREYGIFSQVHYIPVYWNPYYKKLGYKTGLCPNSEEFYGRILSLPIYPAMDKADINLVLTAITTFFEK